MYSADVQRTHFALEIVMSGNQDHERVPVIVVFAFVALYTWVLWEVIPPAPQPLYQISADDAKKYWGKRDVDGNLRDELPNGFRYVWGVNQLDKSVKRIF